MKAIYVQEEGELLCLDRKESKRHPEVLITVDGYDTVWELENPTPEEIIEMILEAGSLGVNYYRLEQIMYGYNIPISIFLSCLHEKNIIITKTKNEYIGSITQDGKQWTAESDHIIVTACEVLRIFNEDVQPDTAFNIE